MKKRTKTLLPTSFMLYLVSFTIVGCLENNLKQKNPVVAESPIGDSA
mgnify:FL=1